MGDEAMFGQRGTNGPRPMGGFGPLRGRCRRSAHGSPSVSATAPLRRVTSPVRRAAQPVNPAQDRGQQRRGIATSAR